MREYEVVMYYTITQTVMADSEDEAIEAALDKTVTVDSFDYCECLNPEVMPTKFGSNNPDL